MAVPSLRLATLPAAHDRSVAGMPRNVPSALRPRQPGGGPARAACA